MTTNDNRAIVRTFAIALARLYDALAQPKNEWTRDAALQRFEFTFELAWKTTMRLVRQEGIECNSPRSTWRAAFKLGWIADDALWLEMLEDRNRTSHTYNEAVAEAIFSRLPTYHAALAHLLVYLEALVAPPTTNVTPSA